MFEQGLVTPSQEEQENIPHKRTLSFADERVKYLDTKTDEKGGASFEHVQELIDNSAEITIRFHNDDTKDICVKKLDDRSVEGVFEGTEEKIGISIDHINQLITETDCEVILTIPDKKSDN